MSNGLPQFLESETTVRMRDRVAAAAFSVGFGVRFGHGRDSTRKHASEKPRTSEGKKAEGRQKALTLEQEGCVQSVGKMISVQDWLGLLSVENDAATVASLLRSRSPEDAALIYGNLGHAHLMTMADPLAVAPIYADHGGTPNWDGGGTCGLHDRTKVVRPKLLQGVCRNHAEQQGWSSGIPGQPNLYLNAPNHRPEAVNAGLLGSKVLKNKQHRGDVSKAIGYYLITLDIACESGELSSETEACSSLGSLYRKIGNYPKAIEYFERKLDRAVAVGARSDEAQAVLSLGLCYFSLARYRKASQLFTQSLDLALVLGDAALEETTRQSLDTSNYHLLLQEKQGQHWRDDIAD